MLFHASIIMPFMFPLPRMPCQPGEVLFILQSSSETSLAAQGHIVMEVEVRPFCLIPESLLFITVLCPNLNL